MPAPPRTAAQRAQAAADAEAGAYKAEMDEQAAEVEFAAASANKARRTARVRQDEVDMLAREAAEKVAREVASLEAEYERGRKEAITQTVLEAHENSLNVLNGTVKKIGTSLDELTKVVQKTITADDMKAAVTAAVSETRKALLDERQKERKWKVSLFSACIAAGGFTLSLVSMLVLGKVI
jgi:hypothetical protein